MSGVVAAALFALSPQALANPTGPATVAGSATFSTSGNTLTVANTSGTIINWQGFSIGAGEATRFVQPAATSAVLNRVVGPSPSSILGMLSSNGKVFLVNPNGILVGEGGRIDVAGLALSTFDISNANFLAGNHVFDGSGGGSIVLNGSVSSNGGDIFLFGSSIVGTGTIDSTGGIIAGGPVVTGTNSSAGTITVSGGNIAVGGSVSSSGDVLLVSPNNVVVTGTINSAGAISVGIRTLDSRSALPVRYIFGNSPGGSIALQSGASRAAGSAVPAGSLASVAVTRVSFNLPKRELSF